jgi:hypothetical protein
MGYTPMRHTHEVHAYEMHAHERLSDWCLGVPRGAWWRQCGGGSLRTPWQTFMYLKSSILQRFDGHTSSSPPSAPSDRDTPHEVHAHEMHAHEMHAYEMHACEMHAYETHIHEVHAHEVHTYKIHACEMHAHEIHTHEVHAHEPFFFSTPPLGAEGSPSAHVYSVPCHSARNTEDGAQYRWRLRRPDHSQSVHYWQCFGWVHKRAEE